MRTANSFIHTSADDCKISLRFCGPDDLEILKDALQACVQLGYKTKANHLAIRIKQIMKELPAGDKGVSNEAGQ